jgi:hypothetical protein
MNGDEIRPGRPRSSQRPIEPPVLPEGSLRALKVVMYRLYVEARQPRVDDVVAEIKELAVSLAGLLYPNGEGDEDGEAEVDRLLGAPSVGRDMIGAIVSGDTLPGSQDDAVAVAVALAHMARRFGQGTRAGELAPLVRQVRELWVSAKIPPPASWAAQPLVCDSPDLDARVLKAALPIPYIRRDLEEEAREHLNARRPLLLVGPSMVGKTRLAVELIRDLFARRRLFAPDSRSALTALLVCRLSFD